MKDACDEAEILRHEEYRKAHAEELKSMLDNVGSRMHNEDMEGDIRRCWTAMRRVTQELEKPRFPEDVTTELENSLWKLMVKFLKDMMSNQRLHHSL